jgi:hypothetical protein
MPPAPIAPLVPIGPPAPIGPPTEAAAPPPASSSAPLANYTALNAGDADFPRVLTRKRGRETDDDKARQYRGRGIYDISMPRYYTK